ncbi:phosphotransferase [Bacillus marasmi]|uniref:phosphotransferase n=1 Tax=Bacillus marasmi TaxID=1926279 RepID=UPI0011CBC6E5|nr:phosphotransferase [Bacillus marasmi]
MKAKTFGDDVFNSRLLSILNKSVPFTVFKVKKIRENVYYIDTDRRAYILKGYSSLHRLHLQEAFTSSLKKHGFLQTYSFLRFSENPVYFNKKYWGWIEYLEPHRESFSYLSEANRTAGLELLHSFHLTTKQFAKSFEQVIPPFQLLEKWQDRFHQFVKNKPVIENYLPVSMYRELLEWGNLALAGMKRENMEFGDDSQPVILHGDVAHHNFLKSKSGKLNLIDFDLISIGHESADLLQYANRILPYLNWSLQNLANHPLFQHYLQHRAFLYALMYPTDIFREWNRIIKNGSCYRPKKLIQTIELTTNQYQQRQQFLKELKIVVK